MSEQLRPGYTSSLGVSSAEVWRRLPKNGMRFPVFFEDIYSVVRGTLHQAADQELVDFLPGYRLIHLSELVSQTGTLSRVYQDAGGALPFLANYSSDYICWSEGCIRSFVHDDPVRHLMHESEAAFWQTVCAFYEEGVYQLRDGFLDTKDLDLESSVGSRFNPGLEYWM